MRIVALLIVTMMMVPCLAVQAHTPNIITVIIKEDRPYPDNIPETTGFVEEDGVWFRMMDSTNNTTLRVSIDIDGDGYFNESLDYFSPWMVFDCAYDENGTLLDSDCVESDVFYFNGANGSGIYDYQVERMINGSHVNFSINTIFVGMDDHSESGLPSVGDCFGAGCEEVITQSSVSTDDGYEKYIPLLMVVSAIGLLGVAISMITEEKEEVKSSEEE